MQKQPYEPPKVVKVRLSKDEMAVAKCKMTTSRTGPTVGCVRSACKDAGS